MRRTFSSSKNALTTVETSFSASCTTAICSSSLESISLVSGFTHISTYDDYIGGSVSFSALAQHILVYPQAHISLVLSVLRLKARELYVQCYYRAQLTGRRMCVLGLGSGLRSRLGSGPALGQQCLSRV